MNSAEHKSKSARGKRGFAILIAIVVATIVLTIGISIINTALREVILASTVRNSLSGFYAADSAVECALYWDNLRGRWGTESAFKSGSFGDIECAGVVVPITGGLNVNFSLADSSDLIKPCANVSVATVSGLEGEERVTVRAEGSNTCNPSNSKRVERALEVRYSRF